MHTPRGETRTFSRSCAATLNFLISLWEYGLADKQVLDRLKSSFLMWGEMPEAFAAEAWGEIVARKA